MNTVRLRFAYAAAGALLATGPFIVLEAVYTSGFSGGIPLALYLFLWASAGVCLYLIFSLVRTKYQAPVRQWIVPFLLKMLVTVPVVFVWTYTVVDQMPCFVGGRGC